MKAKVSLVKCKTYSAEEVGPAIKKAFGLLGGLELFVKKGEKVLLKPNMLSRKTPEQGANTHVEIVRACARLVRDCGAVPIVGDNPGGSLTPKEAYDASGFLNMAKEEGIELGQGKDVKMVRGIPISSYFFECDKIINLPKMKTHSLTTLTGAIKNMYGAVSGLIKTEYHKRFPNPREFVGTLVDVYEIVKPHLVLMDGIVSMDGDGPSAGRLRDTGILMAGSDGVAIDSVFSHLIGVRPSDILTTKEANKRGLGEISLENIEVVGESVSENFIEGFKLPHSKKLFMLPDRTLKMLASFIRFGPYINKDICKKCDICTKSCPVSAIKGFTIDHHRCIRCMCCHEVCPHNAIELRRNFLARVFGL
ncbi:MAG: DUF362 domain-containing protein [Candidatus Gorgyraea atricola]|nr:DUF362 domain-containing protein [Candidatus Gorgyraea atricola]